MADVEVNELPAVTSAAAGDLFPVEASGALSKITKTNLLSTLSITTAVNGVAAGYKIARGEAALDGSNPTSVATGLTTIIAAVATLKGTAAPGLSTCCITANINGTSVDFYAWKPTGAGNPTLIASTGTESFYWAAVGT